MTIQQQIANLLSNRSVTFAAVDYTTEVKTAAAHKDVKIEKHTVANVQLFANIRQATQVFANAVKKNASVANFITSSNYFKHTSCYSIVEHNKDARMYLYCIYNSAKSTFTIDGISATRQQVAQYLTKSAADKLLNPPTSTHNKRNNVTHNVTVRTIKLSNINSIATNGQKVTF